MWTTLWKHWLYPSIGLTSQVRIFTQLVSAHVLRKTWYSPPSRPKPSFHVLQTDLFWKHNPGWDAPLCWWHRRFLPKTSVLTSVFQSVYCHDSYSDNGISLSTLSVCCCNALSLLLKPFGHNSTFSPEDTDFLFGFSHYSETKEREVTIINFSSHNFWTFLGSNSWLGQF